LRLKLHRKQLCATLRVMRTPKRALFDPGQKAIWSLPLPSLFLIQSDQGKRRGNTQLGDMPCLEFDALRVSSLASALMLH
jgi:hypothetical protein